MDKAFFLCNQQISVLNIQFNDTLLHVKSPLNKGFKLSQVVLELFLRKALYNNLAL